MGLKGACRFFTHRFFEITVAVLLITFLPNLPPYVGFSDTFKVVPTKPLTNKLAVNDKLNDVELWHKGDFLGPESFADYNGELYASLYGGDIVKINGKFITPIVKTGKPCKGAYEERICGRPLGIKFDNKGNLFVADAYYGIFKVDVKTGEKVQIVSVDEEINGKKPKVPNSIDIASNGDIYWSDSSTQFSLDDGVFDLLADASGRLIHFDAKTKTNRVLIDKIHFANGVVLADDEEFVLVAETPRNRIRRYYLKGPKKGTEDIFVDGLPGFVDNLSSDGKGGFLVPLLVQVDSEHPSPVQAVAPFPLIRRFVSRLIGISQLIFRTVNQVYPCEFAQKAVHYVGHFSSVTSFFPNKRTTIVRLSRNGEIIDSIHSTNKKVQMICEAHILGDTLLLGSPFKDYIGKVPLSKVGWEGLSKAQGQKRTEPHKVEKREAPAAAKQEEVRQTPPPKQQTPPPKQQTPPPKQQTPPPKQQTPPPKQQTVPPKQQTPPPKQQTPPPKQQTPPPKQQTAPPKQQAPPPKQQSLQQQAPPPKQQTPPPKQQTPPPPRQQTQPSKQETNPPPKQQTQPPKQQTPPPKQEAPMKQQSPPPKQQTPPVKQKEQSATQPTKEQPSKIPNQKAAPSQGDKIKS